MKIKAFVLLISLVILTLVVLNFGAFKSKIISKTNSEGTIVYSLTYPKIETNNIIMSLLPKEMTLVYSNGVYKSEVSGGLGMMTIGFISNNSEKKVDHFMRFVNTKYASRFKDKKANVLYKKFPKFIAKDLDTSKVVVGYNCTGTLIDFVDENLEDLVFWHTNEIDLGSSNWCSPFPEISGVLLDYYCYIIEDRLFVHVEASNVFSNSIDPKKSLELPKDYQVVSNGVFIDKKDEAFNNFQF